MAILQLLLMTLCRTGCLIVLGSHVITVTIALTNMVNAATVDHVTLLLRCCMTVLQLLHSCTSVAAWLHPGCNGMIVRIAFIGCVDDIDGILSTVSSLLCLNCSLECTWLMPWWPTATLVSHLLATMPLAVPHKTRSSTTWATRSGLCV